MSCRSRQTPFKENDDLDLGSQRCVLDCMIDQGVDEAGLGEDADLPAVEIVEGLHQVLGAASLGLSSVTRMAPILQAWARAMTFPRSTRSFLAPDAVSL